jgi:hypothetical protein
MFKLEYNKRQSRSFEVVAIALSRQSTEHAREESGQMRDWLVASVQSAASDMQFVSAMGSTSRAAHALIPGQHLT